MRPHHIYFVNLFNKFSKAKLEVGRGKNTKLLEHSILALSPRPLVRTLHQKNLDILLAHRTERPLYFQ